MYGNIAKKKAEEAAKAKLAASRKSGILKGVIAGAVVVIGAVVAFFMLTAKEEVKEEVKVEKEEVKAVEDNEEVAMPTKEVEVKEEDPAKKARREMLKNMTIEERREFLYEEQINKPLDLEPKTNRTFRTGTEQVMSWIFTTNLGDMPPPLPRISDREALHIVEIIQAGNPVFESDNDKVKDAKEMVSLAKKELEKFVAEGGDVQDFLEYYREQLVDAHKEYNRCRREVIKVIQEEPELAAEYIKEVNAQLSEKGIKHVKLPKKYEEELGL